MQDASLYFGDTTAATWFALAAMLSFVVGIKCSQLGMRADPAALALHREARAWPPRKAFVFCMVTIAIAAIFERLRLGFSDGLRQPIPCGRPGIQWAGVFALACVCAAQGRGYGYLLVVMMFLETVKGFTGYFSDFKLVFFVLILAVFFCTPRTLYLGPSSAALPSVRCLC